MTQHQRVAKHFGFTLLETIIYVGLFGVLMAGLISAVYPYLKHAEKNTTGILTASESAFIEQKVLSVFAQTNAIIEPNADEVGDTLTVATYTGDTYTFGTNNGAFAIRINEGDALLLSAERVNVQNFLITHHAPTEHSSRYVEYSFTADNALVGPIRYYFQF